MGGWGGWLDTDNKTISVQLDLTGTATGTELGNIYELARLGLQCRTPYPLTHDPYPYHLSLIPTPSSLSPSSVFKKFWWGLLLLFPKQKKSPRPRNGVGKNSLTWTHGKI